MSLITIYYYLFIFNIFQFIFRVTLIKLLGLSPHIFNLLNFTGHAPAGGCVLAMCCDSRIMVSGKSKIGLNESKVGIVAPYW